MKLHSAAIFLGFAVCCASAPRRRCATARPKAGKVEILPLDQVKPGMKGVAWTVFQGTEPEPIPIEIIGRWKDMWGPKQDIIIAKMGGKALRTNVAAGMSGSPVYIDGKLVGAVALRLSVFSRMRYAASRRFSRCWKSRTSTNRGPTIRARRPSLRRVATRLR